MKKIFIVTILGILFSLSITEVRAETISYKRLDNIYYNLTVDGETTSNHVTMFYLDNRLAYCIDPGASINTHTYNSTSNWNQSNLNPETQKYIEKIGYYGYEYPNHQTPKYYIATQELIWEAIKNVNIYWTTGENGTGSIIDVSTEKKEILNLIEKHKTIPSFAGDIISAKKGTHYILEDYNGVLNNFDISSSKYHIITKDDNKLIIDFNEEVKEEEIILTRKNQYNDLLLVYTMPGSQSLASLRISTPEKYTFKLKSVEIPKEYPKKEIVKVPSTDFTNKVTIFNTEKFYRYDLGRFN